MTGSERRVALQRGRANGPTVRGATRPEPRPLVSRRGGAYIRAKAAITKNSKEARQFLSADVAAALKEHVARKAPQVPVFALPSGREDMAAMLLADVALARSAWLKAAADDADERLQREQSDFLRPGNDRGEVLDFHGLRHTCGAWYIEAGAGPKEVQALMRHATITLTMDTYGHLFQGQESETVKKLRPLLNAGETCQWIHQSSDFHEGRLGPPAAADCRTRPDSLESSNPIRYNGFDVDRRSQLPSAVVGRSPLEGKRIGQRPDSKSGAPQGVVGSNPMPSAMIKAPAAIAVAARGLRETEASCETPGQ